MSGVINIKRKPNTVRPDDFSGVYLKPIRGRGNGVFGASMNSSTTPGFIKVLGYLVLTLAAVFFLCVATSYFTGFGGDGLVGISGLLFIFAHLIFLASEFLFNSELPRRGLSMLLLWGTMGLVFWVLMIEAILF